MGLEHVLSAWDAGSVGEEFNPMLKTLLAQMGKCQVAH